MISKCACHNHVWGGLSLPQRENTIRSAIKCSAHDDSEVLVLLGLRETIVVVSTFANMTKYQSFCSSKTFLSFAFTKKEEKIT